MPISVVEPSAPVKKADRADALAELEAARACISGWADRLQATRADHSAEIGKLDSAASQVREAMGLLKVMWPELEDRPQPQT